MISYRITHKTLYEYQLPVAVCHNEVHLQPRTLEHQLCRFAELEISPTPAVSASRRDFFGNRVTYFAVQQPHETLIVTARSEVQVAPPPPLDADSTTPWDTVRLQLADGTAPEILQARPFVLDSPFIVASPELADYARPCFAPHTPLLTAAYALMHQIHEQFTFDPEFSTVATPLMDVLVHRRGVCQDFAHVAVGCLRSLGLAARYVSGYLETVPPPGQPRLVGADASHAWCSVFVPDIGWCDFDPTTCLIPGLRHVTVAIGRDYGDVTPLKGVILGGGEHTLSVSVDVERVPDLQNTNGTPTDHTTPDDTPCAV